MIYKNQFRNVWRKFVNGKGFISSDGVLWEESGAPEKLIKRLSYYVEEKQMNLQNIGPELTEDQKEELEKVREALKEMVADRKIVILGCGNHPGGYSALSGLVNAETISLEAITSRPANNIIMIDNDVDYAKFKIVKGRGHDKLKKKKRK